MDNSGIQLIEGILLRNLYTFEQANSNEYAGRMSSHVGLLNDHNIRSLDRTIAPLKAGTVPTLFKKVPNTTTVLYPMIVRSTKMDKTYWATKHMWFTEDFKPVMWITDKAKVTVSPNIYRDVDDPLCKYIRDKVLIALYKSDYEVKIEEIPFTVYKHSKASFNFNKVFYEYEEE